MINENMINEVLDLMNGVKESIKEAEGMKIEAESIIASSTKQLKDLEIILAKISG